MPGQTDCSAMLTYRTTALLEVPLPLSHQGMLIAEKGSSNAMSYSPWSKVNRQPLAGGGVWLVSSGRGEVSRVMYMGGFVFRQCSKT